MTAVAALSGPVAEMAPCGDHLFRDRFLAIRAAVDRAEWRGRAGCSDLLVMRELLAVTMIRGSLVVGMNLRSLAERTGLSLKGVWGATRRLKTKGFLKVAAASRPFARSTTWRLCPPPTTAYGNRELREDTFPYRTKCCFQTPQSALDVDVARDLWRGGRGFGKVRQRVHAALGRGGGGRTISELAAEARCHRRTVERALAVFVLCGLAERDGRLWRRGPADVDDVARAYGVARTGAEQRRRHRREREAFRGWLAERERRMPVDRETGEVLTPPRVWPRPAIVSRAERAFGAVAEVRRIAVLPPPALCPPVGAAR